VNVLYRLPNLDRVHTSAARAEKLARTLLEVSLPRRWAHVQGVAAQASALAPILGPETELLEAAAWLHDIGYAPMLTDTGLHGLDGARYLREAEHAGQMLCRLVAHHSCAIIEAEERGLGTVLQSEFKPPRQDLANALTFCDMTTSPDGKRVHVSRRLSEIHRRYGPDHLVSHSIRRATPMILDAVEQVRARMARTSDGNCPAHDLRAGRHTARSHSSRSGNSSRSSDTSRLRVTTCHARDHQRRVDGLPRRTHARPTRPTDFPNLPMSGRCVPVYSCANLYADNHSVMVNSAL
jgi:hypothetical protein